MDSHHSVSHFEDRACTTCGEAFDSEASLLSHLKQFAAKPTGLLAFNIEIYQLEDYQISSWAEYPMVCRHCGVRLADREGLVSHCVEVHKQCFGAKCIDCDEEVERFEEFLKHVAGHRSALKNICPYCNETIDPASNHISEHSTNRHPCNICGEIYNKRSLRLHQALMWGTTSPPPKTTKKRRKNLPPPTLEDLTCHICGGVLSTVASLKTHLEKHSERTKDHTCDRCGKAYYAKGSLDVHRLMHENVRKHICKICNKGFLTVSRLKKHIVTHNLSKPFQCDHCQKQFCTKERLRNHVKVHMDVMPFQCRFCTKKFRYKSIMKTHENQHTGARPYSCDACPMEFANWSNCNKHMKRKHNKTLAKHVMTPFGKVALDPETGKPCEVQIDSGVKEWSESVLRRKQSKRKKKLVKVL